MNIKEKMSSILKNINRNVKMRLIRDVIEYVAREEKSLRKEYRRLPLTWEAFWSYIEHYLVNKGLCSEVSFKFNIRVEPVFEKQLLEDLSYKVLKSTHLLKCTPCSPLFCNEEIYEIVALEKIYVKNRGKTELKRDHIIHSFKVLEISYWEILK